MPQKPELGHIGARAKRQNVNMNGNVVGVALEFALMQVAELRSPVSLYLQLAAAYSLPMVYKMTNNQGEEVEMHPYHRKRRRKMRENRKRRCTVLAKIDAGTWSVRLLKSALMILDDLLMKR